MSGFDNEVVYANNWDFRQTAPVVGQVTLAGQLPIGTGGTSPAIRVGVIRSPNGTISVGYIDPDITVDLVGGGTGIDSIGTQTGTNPIAPDGAGLVTINGAVVAAGSNPVRSHGTAADTMAIEVQTSQALAATDATKIGLANFDSASFSVDANGFVQLSAGATYKSLSPYIVGSDAHAGYTTIALAIAAAVADGASSTNPANIYIKPKTTGGAYTENITLTDGINIVGFNEDVSLIGTATMTTAGTATISGLKLQTNAAVILAVTGSAASIVYLYGCYLNCTNNNGINHTSSSGSSQIYLFGCQGNLGTTGIALFTSTAAGNIYFRNCTFTNTGSSVTANTVSVGGVYFHHSSLPYCFSNSGTTAGFQGFHSFFEPNLNTTVFNITSTNANGSSFDFCYFSSNAAACLTIGAGAIGVVRDGTFFTGNNPCITGAGTLQYSNLTFQSSSAVNVTTLTPLPTLINNALSIVKTPGAYPYTVLPTDIVVLVDTSSARGITLTSSPATGQQVYIKDNVGSAASNNITITPAAGNIDGAGTFVMNVAYGCTHLIYNGTQWNVL